MFFVRSGQTSSSQTVFGDLVSLMHREVENSLRGFSVDQPHATVAVTASSTASGSTPLTSTGSSSPSSRTTRCVRDVCDAIIANSFRQSDDALPQLWSVAGSTESCIDSSQQQQQQQSTPDSVRRSSPSSVDSDSRSAGRQQPLARDNDRVSPPVNSDGQAPLSSKGDRSEKSTGCSKEDENADALDTGNQSPATIVDNKSETSDSLKPEMTGTTDSCSDAAGGAASDTEHQISDIDLFDDQPPLCIDLNRTTSDDEDESTAPATGGELPAETTNDEPEALKSASGDKTDGTDPATRSVSGTEESKPWRKRTRLELHESDSDLAESSELRGREPKVKKTGDNRD